MEELREELESRFKDIRKYKEFFNFTENPFHVPASSLTPVIQDLSHDHAAVQCKILELQANVILQVELKNSVYNFWNMVSDTDYAALKKCLQKVM